jgi:hypothetical protein
LQITEHSSNVFDLTARGAPAKSRGLRNTL